METYKSILHELYVYSEWKPEPEYLQKSDNILPENISALWCWLNFFGSKKSLLDSITAHKERQHKWHMALGDEGKVIAVLTDTILEIRTRRSEYATIAARTTVSRDPYPQWRRLAWSPDCAFVAVAHGNGAVSFFDLTGANLFNIPADCSRPDGRECTDNTHAVADIIFMPLRVKDNKWNWEVLIVTYDGRLRGFVVSQTERYKLHHTFRFARAALGGGGVAAARYCRARHMLYVAGVPRASGQDPTSPVNAGITAWRILNDEPFYTLSVVSGELEAALASERLRLYMPFVSNKHLAFIVHMELSPDGSRLACLHCNGDVSVWGLPLLKLLRRWPLGSQPQHDLRNPLVSDERGAKRDLSAYFAGDVNWWSNEEVILSRFSGAVTVCNVEDMINILGKKPEFFQGSPQVTCAYEGTFMALECETNDLPANRTRSDDSMEVVEAESDPENSMLELAKELIKSVLYAITDIETFQPRPKKITVVSRVYRLLGVKSTTPDELFSRKIESGNYAEALTLAETFNLDSDLVYQQQWRKNPVSTDAIQKYLSKVSKKIWAVHQCVDRLPETLPAARELLQFGLLLTNEKILDEVNKDRPEDEAKAPDDVTLEDLNAYTSELLRCRHVILFYKERLRLYEDILRCEKSTYVKDEYDRLRSHSVVQSAMEIAKEGRIEALTCLWPYIKTTALQLAVLDNLPETTSPLDYQQLLPTTQPLEWFEKEKLSPIKIKPLVQEDDWCRKEIFRSIWSSNWSEDSTPETEAASDITASTDEVSVWYDRRAREIEARSGLVSHAVTLVTIAAVGGAVQGLDEILFHLLTLDTLIYDVNLDRVTLEEIEKMSTLDTCCLLMKMSTPATFVSDLKQFVIPFLKRYENLTKRPHSCLIGLTDYLESISVDDLSSILLVLQSPCEFELDVRTHLELAEKCLFAHTGTDQLDKACDLLKTILKESDGSISSSELVRRVKEMESLVSASSRMAWRGVLVPPRDLRDLRDQPRDLQHAHNLLTRVARSLSIGNEKPTPQDWEKLLNDIILLQTTLNLGISRVQCYEIYASSLLTSGDAASIKLASEVLTCDAGARRNSHLVDYARSVELVSNAAKEYFNSASSLTDPALELARCCLTLIKDGNTQLNQELDMISALQILSDFNLTILPIQVRLCEDKMRLIDDCLQSDPSAYLASHKLLKLAKLLRVAVDDDDDDQTTEGEVLLRVGEYAARAGAGGGAAAVRAARRLAALRYAPAAPLLARVAADAHAHADTPARQQLLAAAAAHCAVSSIEEILRARQALELEGLQPAGAVRAERAASADDEFADAVTTPVIESKDLVAPPPPPQEKKLQLLNYLLDTVQNRGAFSEKSSTPDPFERSPHCLEFYRSLYPDYAVSDATYRYDRFSASAAEPRCPQAALHCFYAQSCASGERRKERGALEAEVIQKCAEELLCKDTAFSVACLLRSTEGGSQARRLLAAQSTDTAVCAALYATLAKCNTPQLRDNAYFTRPSKMARITLKEKKGSAEQMEIIRLCMDKLSGMGVVLKLRNLGFDVNGLLFNADEDYRQEMIYRVARSPDKKHLELAMSLASKYNMDSLEVWLQHAQSDPSLQHLSTDSIPRLSERAHERINKALWPLLRGDDHNAVMKFFTLLKSVDERPPVLGLTASEHIKLLKKAKAAARGLDYRLLVESPSPSEFLAHILSVMKPENVGLLTKFLRGLPLSFRLPVSVNTLYTMWLTQLFYSVPPANTSSKKWMQQYRQCAGYFTKLSKGDLMKFLCDTCFTQEALERVPSGTRNLMLMQAVDYCQQEQENEIKTNKKEQTWDQVGQELARWARFLENYHSHAARTIIDKSGVPRDHIWPDLEMSHGDPDKIISCAGRLLMETRLPSSALCSLLECVGAPVTPLRLLRHVAGAAGSAEAVETLVTRLTEYHKDGVALPDDLIDVAMQKAAEHRLPPYQQISLLSLRQRTQVLETGDMAKIAQFSIELFKAQWPELDFERDITEEKLLEESGRRQVFHTLLGVCNSLQSHKALIDALTCWPAATEGAGSDVRSLQCEYIDSLLRGADQKQSLLLIKLLLRYPLLTDQEVQWLCERARGEATAAALWVALLHRGERCVERVRAHVARHEEWFRTQDIDDELIKELLGNGMLVKLVSTPLYPAIVNYVIRNSSVANPPTKYTVPWAAKELKKAHLVAEAGHLKLLARGTPAPLRGFSQSVLFKKMFNK